MHDRRTTRRRSGFTLVELLVTIGIIVILVALLLPVLSKARSHAYAASCLGNERQLIQAALSYASDNAGSLPGTNWDDDGLGNPQGWLYNPNTQAVPGPSAGKPGTFSPSDLQTGALYPYLNSATIYRCPSDNNTYVGNTVQLLTSYIMNGAVSDFNYANSEPLRRFKATAVVFWENATTPVDSGAINDGSNSPNEGIATRHTHGCSVAYADGHAEQMTWTAFSYEWATHAPGFLWCAPKYADGGPSELNPPLTIPTTPPAEPLNAN
jgi:prepilin-type N-terminal cleavage/methylation domain-containing protein/prepilin-type processing-associated H-X9-DG protein